jgi:hypothetical protein
MFYSLLIKKIKSNTQKFWLSPTRYYTPSYPENQIFNKSHLEVLDHK